MQLVFKWEKHCRHKNGELQSEIEFYVQCFLTACQLCSLGKTKGEARRMAKTPTNASFGDSTEVWAALRVCMPLSQRGTPEVSDTKISLCACSLFFSFHVCLFRPAPGLRDIVENFECLRILYIRWTATQYNWAIYQSRVSLHQAWWWKYSLNRFRQRTQ